MSSMLTAARSASMTSHFPVLGDMLLPWNEQDLENVTIRRSETVGHWNVAGSNQTYEPERNWKPRKAAMAWLKLKAAFGWANYKIDGCDKTGEGAGVLRHNNTFDVTTFRVYTHWVFVDVQLDC
ncbi:hypothetical protein NL676_033166 [Syzygium grande]|nr:hypothetical protein NL676_033166 [Syzygium grande]